MKEALLSNYNFSHLFFVRVHKITLNFYEKRQKLLKHLLTLFTSVFLISIINSAVF